MGPANEFNGYDKSKVKMETLEIFLNTVCAKDYRRPKAKDL